MLLKLFMDLWLHEHSYRYTPAVATAVAVLSLFTILRWFGLSAVGIFLNFVNISIFLCLSQLSIKQQVGRVCVGATTGLIFTYFSSFLGYMEHYRFLSGGLGHVADPAHAQALNGPGTDTTAGEGEGMGASGSWSDGTTLASMLLVILCYLLVAFHRAKPAHLRATGARVGISENRGGDVESSVLNIVAAAKEAAVDPVMEELASFHGRLGGGFSMSRGGRAVEFSSARPSPMHRSTSHSGAMSANTSTNDLRTLSRASSVNSTTMNVAAMGCDEDRYSEYTAQQSVQPETHAVGFHLCTVCLVNQVTLKGRSLEAVTTSERTAVHCPFCRCCTLEADHHCMYLGNCVGKGNIRSYCWFLLVVCLSLMLWFSAAIYAQYHYAPGTEPVAASNAAAVCLANHPPGGAWFSRMRLQSCLFIEDPGLFVLTWGALFLAIFSAYSLYQQLVFIIHKTTSYYALEKKYPLVSPGGSAQLTVVTVSRTLFKFFWTGRYIISPVIPEKSRRHGLTHTNTGEDEEEEEEEEDQGGQTTSLLGGLRNTLWNPTTTSKATI